MSGRIGSIHGHQSAVNQNTRRRSPVGRIVTFILAILLAPLAAEAQQPSALPRVAYLALAPGPWATPSEALVQGLRELGHVEGQTIVIEYRWSAGSIDRLREHATELVRLGVDVIVTGGPLATRAAKDATDTIPVVMARDSDPVGDGFVASLARPGGNITGVAGLIRELSAKRLELLKETVPRITRVAVFWNPTEVGADQQLLDTEAAARALDLQVQAVEIRGPDDFEDAFEAALEGRADGLTVLRDGSSQFHRARLVELAARSRLPAIYWDRVFAEAGGLMAYGASGYEMHRRAAYFVDRILKGAAPADLPVEQPTQVELLINLKTAKALGITIPPAILLRADEVIE